MTPSRDIYGSEDQPRRYRARSYDDLDEYAQNQRNDRKQRRINQEPFDPFAPRMPGAEQDRASYSSRSGAEQDRASYSSRSGAEQDRASYGSRSGAEQDRASYSSRPDTYDDDYLQDTFDDGRSRGNRSGGYDELDEYAQDYLNEQSRMRAERSHAQAVRRASSAYGRSREHFDEEGRIDSVYRPTRNRSRYDRSSNRYTSVNANNRREGRREIRNDSSASQHTPAQRTSQQAGAARYSRDRYMRQNGQHHAMPVSQQSYAAANRAKPINPKLFMILGGIALLLLIVIIGRFIVFGGTASQFNELTTRINQEQTQLDELDASNSEMETQMELWQQTIDIYNQAKK